MGFSNNDDRRKYSRVRFTTRIEIILKTGGKQVILEANSKDLSLKGVFAQTDQHFSLDTRCKVHIYLTGGVEEIRLVIEGCIVRHTDAGIGVVFESMDVDTYTHLKNIVRYNTSDESM